MACPPVCWDNSRTLVSGLSYVQVDKQCITILYHLHQCRPCTSRDISYQRVLVGITCMGQFQCDPTTLNKRILLSIMSIVFASFSRQIIYICMTVTCADLEEGAGGLGPPLKITKFRVP